jgi:hypothetical protein
LHDRFEVVFGGFDVESYGLLFNVWVAANDHDVCTCGELINEGCEFLVTYHHRLELVGSLDAAELELFDNIRDLLKSV